MASMETNNDRTCAADEEVRGCGVVRCFLKFFFFLFSGGQSADSSGPLIACWGVRWSRCPVNCSQWLSGREVMARPVFWDCLSSTSVRLAHRANGRFAATFVVLSVARFISPIRRIFMRFSWRWRDESSSLIRCSSPSIASEWVFRISRRFD